MEMDRTWKGLKSEFGRLRDAGKSRLKIPRSTSHIATVNDLTYESEIIIFFMFIRMIQKKDIQSTVSTHLYTY